MGAFLDCLLQTILGEIYNCTAASPISMVKYGGCEISPAILCKSCPDIYSLLEKVEGSDRVWFATKEEGKRH
jgi:hypothetical protein